MIEVSLKLLGQSGCRIEYDGTVIYMDPYLSNSAQELDAPDLERLIPVPVQPESVTDADWVMITPGSHRRLVANPSHNKDQSIARRAP